MVCGCVFFFKQKTAYEMLRSLVGSEMCIRDRDYTLLMLRRILGRARLTEREARTLLGLVKNIRWRIEATDSGSAVGKKQQEKDA